MAQGRELRVPLILEARLDGIEQVAQAMRGAMASTNAYLAGPMGFAGAAHPNAARAAEAAIQQVQATGVPREYLTNPTAYAQRIQEHNARVQQAGFFNMNDPTGQANYQRLQRYYENLARIAQANGRTLAGTTVGDQLTAMQQTTGAHGQFVSPVNGRGYAGVRALTAIGDFAIPSQELSDAYEQAHMSPAALAATRMRQVRGQISGMRTQTEVAERAAMEAHENLRKLQAAMDLVSGRRQIGSREEYEQLKAQKLLNFAGAGAKQLNTLPFIRETREQLGQVLGEAEQRFPLSAQPVAARPQRLQQVMNELRTVRAAIRTARQATTAEMLQVEQLVEEAKTHKQWLTDAEKRDLRGATKQARRYRRTHQGPEIGSSLSTLNSIAAQLEADAANPTLTDAQRRNLYARARYHARKVNMVKPDDLEALGDGGEERARVAADEAQQRINETKRQRRQQSRSRAPSSRDQILAEARLAAQELSGLRATTPVGGGFWASVLGLGRGSGDPMAQEQARILWQKVQKAGKVSEFTQGSPEFQEIAALTAGSRRNMMDILGLQTAGAGGGRGPGFARMALAGAYRGFPAASAQVSNMMRQSGIPIYGLGLFGAGAVGMGAIRGSVNEYMELEKMQLMLAGIFKTFTRFRPYAGTTPSDKIGIVPANQQFGRALEYAKEFYPRLRQVAVQSPLTAKELADVFSTSYPFLARKQVGVESGLRMTNIIASLGKMMGLRPESVRDDIRAIVTGHYKNVQTFQAAGVSATEFRRMSKLQGPEFEAAFFKTFGGYSEALEKFQDTLVSKVDRLADRLIQTGQAFGGKLAEKLGGSTGTLTTTLDRWNKDGTLDQFADVTNQLIGILTSVAEFVARNGGVLLEAVKWFVGYRALAGAGNLVGTFIGAAHPAHLRPFSGLNMTPQVAENMRENMRTAFIEAQTADGGVLDDQLLNAQMATVGFQGFGARMLSRAGAFAQRTIGHPMFGGARGGWLANLATFGGARAATTAAATTSGLAGLGMVAGSLTALAGVIYGSVEAFKSWNATMNGSTHDLESFWSGRVAKSVGRWLGKPILDDNDYTRIESLDKFYGMGAMPIERSKLNATGLSKLLNLRDEERFEAILETYRARNRMAREGATPDDLYRAMNATVPGAQDLFWGTKDAKGVLSLYREAHGEGANKALEAGALADPLVRAELSRYLLEDYLPAFAKQRGMSSLLVEYQQRGLAPETQGFAEYVKLTDAIAAAAKSGDFMKLPAQVLAEVLHSEVLNAGKMAFAMRDEATIAAMIRRYSNDPDVLGAQAYEITGMTSATLAGVPHDLTAIIKEIGRLSESIMNVAEEVRLAGTRFTYFMKTGQYTEAMRAGSAMYAGEVRQNDLEVKRIQAEMRKSKLESTDAIKEETLTGYTRGDKRTIYVNDEERRQIESVMAKVDDVAPDDADAATRGIRLKLGSKAYLDWIARLAAPPTTGAGGAGLTGSIGPGGSGKGTKPPKGQVKPFDPTKVKIRPTRPGDRDDLRAPGSAPPPIEITPGLISAAESIMGRALARVEVTGEPTRDAEGNLVPGQPKGLDPAGIAAFKESSEYQQAYAFVLSFVSRGAHMTAQKELDDAVKYMLEHPGAFSQRKLPVEFAKRVTEDDYQRAMLATMDPQLQLNADQVHMQEEVAKRRKQAEAVNKKNTAERNAAEQRLKLAETRLKRVTLGEKFVNDWVGPAVLGLDAARSSLYGLRRQTGEADLSFGIEGFMFARRASTADYTAETEMAMLAAEEKRDVLEAILQNAGAIRLSGGDTYFGVKVGEGGMWLREFMGQADVQRAISGKSAAQVLSEVERMGSQVTTGSYSKAAYAEKRKQVEQKRRASHYQIAQDRFSRKAGFAQRSLALSMADMEWPGMGAFDQPGLIQGRAEMEKAYRYQVAVSRYGLGLPVDWEEFSLIEREAAVQTKKALENADWQIKSAREGWAIDAYRAGAKSPRDVTEYMQTRATQLGTVLQMAQGGDKTAFAEYMKSHGEAALTPELRALYAKDATGGLEFQKGIIDALNAIDKNTEETARNTENARREAGYKVEDARFAATGARRSKLDAYRMNVDRTMARAQNASLDTVRARLLAGGVPLQALLAMNESQMRLLYEETVRNEVYDPETDVGLERKEGRRSTIEQAGTAALESILFKRGDPMGAAAGFFKPDFSPITQAIQAGDIFKLFKYKGDDKSMTARSRALKESLGTGLGYLGVGAMYGSGANDYSQEGAGIGGMLGPSVFASLGPWGAGAGVLLGGLLGGMFKKPEPDKDKLMQNELQKRMVELLSSIDKRLRPSEDYYNTVKGAALWGSPGRYLAGRYSSFGAQSTLVLGV